MSGAISLRGYAVPFDQAAHCEGHLEYVQPGAFDAQAKASAVAGVFLNTLSHDAPPVGTVVEIFSDGYGLGFSARVEPEHWRDLRPFVAGRHNFCSVMLADMRTERVRHDDESYRVITGARVEHITICGDNATYYGTGVWPAEIVGNYPPRIAALASRWEQGNARWQSLQTTRRWVANERDARRQARERGVPRTVMDFLKPREAGFAAMRNAWAKAVVTSGSANGVVMGHVAFTKAGGFDGDYDRLLAVAARTVKTQR